LSQNFGDYRAFKLCFSSKILSLYLASIQFARFQSVLIIHLKAAISVLIQTTV